MIVQPGLIRHPKFLGFARKVGGEGLALGILIRLWGHCQECKRGEFWGAVGADYVEAVCEWEGPAGRCFEALRFPLGPDRPGWIEVDEEDNLTVHDWDEANRSLIAAWSNATKSAAARRARKIAVRGAELSSELSSSGMREVHAHSKQKLERELVLSSDLSSELSSSEKRRGEKSREESTPLSPSAVGVAEVSEPVVPSVEAMLNFFQARGEGVTEAVCRKYAEWMGERDQWLIKNGRGDLIVRPWQKEVPRWQLRERSCAPGGKSGGGAEDLAEELGRINAELQWMTREKNAARFEWLLKRREELEKLGVRER